MLQWLEQGTIDLTITRYPFKNEFGKLNEDYYDLMKLVTYKDFPLTFTALQTKLVEKEEKSSWYFPCYYGSSNILDELINKKKFLTDYLDDGVPLFGNETPLVITIRGLLKFKDEDKFLTTIKSLIKTCPEMILMETIEKKDTFLPYQLVMAEELYYDTECLMINKTIEQLTLKINGLMIDYKKRSNEYYDISIEKLLKLNLQFLATACDDLSSLYIDSPETSLSVKKTIGEFDELQEIIKKFEETYNLNLHDDDLTNPKDSYGIS